MWSVIWRITGSIPAPVATHTPASPPRQTKEPTVDPLRLISTRRTAQSEPADPRQVTNAAGGYTFTVDDQARLHRFLTLGTGGGTYYVPRSLRRAGDGHRRDRTQLPDRLFHRRRRPAQAGTGGRTRSCRSSTSARADGPTTSAATPRSCRWVAPTVPCRWCGRSRTVLCSTCSNRH